MLKPTYRYTGGELVVIKAAAKSGEENRLADAIWDPILLSEEGYRLADAPSMVRPADCRIDPDQYERLGRTVSAAMSGLWLTVGPARSDD